MSLSQDITEKRRSFADFGGGGVEKHRRPQGDISTSCLGHDQFEQEKRVRREIANSNERRRMQSINAGFDSLRILLPPIQDGEKMSKATILQLTAKYINNLLMRLNVLENEVAVYRQSAGLHGSSITSMFHEEIEVSRKRRVDESKRHADHTRSRRRKVDVDSLVTNQQYIVPCTPTQNSHIACTGIHATPVSPGSPRPESTSSTAARLEHLVMAIEQIEGSRALHISPSSDSQDESFSVDRSPSLPSESYWQSPQCNYQSFTYSVTQSSAMKPSISPFTEELIFAHPTTDVNTDLHSSSVAVAKQESSSSIEDYPIVSKLLNRPIPHKYLHRPQVVVNSSH